MAKSTHNLFKKQKKIYLDYASSALSISANPGAIHILGLKEKNKLENARKKTAHILNAHTKEVIFTSGATESNNLAILGLVQNFTQKINLPHIITTNIEHSSVLEVFKYLEKTKKAEVTFVPVEKNGIIDPKKIKKYFKKNTVLVSIMYANNEIGTIQPIKEIAKEIRYFNKTHSSSHVFFHTDATQAINYLSVNVEKLGIDMLSFNSAKIYGPKGVGILYIRKNTPVTKIMYGGEQEFGLRPGTENVFLATGIANALEKTEKIKEKENQRLFLLRDYFLSKIQKMLKTVSGIDIIVNGSIENRLPNNINITIPNIPSDLLVIELSAKGIMISSKSACKIGDGKASYVIEAIRDIKNNLEIDGSLRFSLGRETTKKDIDFTLKILSQILNKLKKWYL